MPYRVDLAPAAQRELRRLPALARSRLAAPILELARSPRPPGALIVILRVARRSESTYSSL